jgi:hypothetical protein
VSATVATSTNSELRQKRVATPRGSHRKRLQSLPVRSQAPPLLSRGSQVRVLPGAPRRPSGSAATRFARRERFRVLPGALRFADSFEKQRVRSSVPTRHQPSENVNFRVAARVAGSLTRRPGSACNARVFRAESGALAAGAMRAGNMR